MAGARRPRDDSAMHQHPLLVTRHRLLLVKLGPWVDDDDRELPRRGYGYRPGMSGADLYSSARAWWRLSRERAGRCEVLVAVHGGVTVGAWSINQDGWRVWDHPTVGSGLPRWSLTGVPVTGALEAELVGRTVPATRADGRSVFGSGAVVAYWPE